jgi:hypothetical protein
MTRPKIDDAQIQRAYPKFCERVGYIASQRVTPADLKFALEAALDRRVGGRDRRKVFDLVAAEKSQDARPFRSGRNLESNGRRAGDKNWQMLPEPIHVSEGMKKAGGVVCREQWHKTQNSFEECAAEVYRVMRAKEIEEGKAPCGATFQREAMCGYRSAPNQRSGRDRRKP